MAELKVKVVSPKDPAGWLETNLPKSVMEILQSYIETAKKNPININNELVGNISKSLLIEDKDNWFFNNILTPLCSDYLDKFPFYGDSMNVLTGTAPLCLERFWVNFQKENEFNPLHNLE